MNIRGGEHEPQRPDYFNMSKEDAREARRSYERELKEYEKFVAQQLSFSSEAQLIFSHTPFFFYAHLLLPPPSLEVRFSIPTSPRFEGTWMIAPSGSGKTNALLNLIGNDLELVKQGKCSVVVIDSAGTAEGRFMHYLSRHALFAPGQELHDKLVYLEPDVEHPLALNLFDVGQDRISRLSPNEKLEAANAAREMLKFVLSGLLGQELTKKQAGVFAYLVEAMLTIPEATVFTLGQLLEDAGYEKHRHHILEMDEWARDFFEKRFRTPTYQRGEATHKPKRHQYAATKLEIFNRIDQMLKDVMFRKMYSHKQNRLNMFENLQAGKVILINTNFRRLGRDGMEVFGRFMLAQLYQAASQRLDVAEDKNLPVYVYIDECHQFLKDEPKIIELLDELARKNKIGFIFAHQRTDQVSPAVLNAFSSTAVRFASRNEKQDAAYVSSALRVEPQTLLSLPVGTFASLVRGATDTALGLVRFPKILDRIPLMSEDAFATVQKKMWKEYSGEEDPMPTMEAPPDSGAPEDKEFEDKEDDPYADD